ncbi:hypothetical protein GCM10010302_45020 [Streptomyces polychromogenes]|uniref:Uncharacterized protein n=1 Tax=Streptomyces polychromogenes TaxID=67342 RepID=A0ABP3F647_9ACTN
MPEPLESPEKILSPARPVDLALLETGGAGSIRVGVVEAMVFPVCVGGEPPGGGAPDSPGWRGRVPGSGPPGRGRAGPRGSGLSLVAPEPCGLAAFGLQGLTRGT